MRNLMSRRNLLRSSAAAGLGMGLGNIAFLNGLRPVRADEAELAPQHVRLDPSIDPVVELIEETPRAQLLERVAAEIQNGLTYRELLAGLLLAGVKNVEPRPSVGFKFHAVLVVNSAHLASLSSPDEHRWLPLFWALDYYKSAAARDVAERGDWTMSRLRDSELPKAHQALGQFTGAMENWDEAAADAAVARLARTSSLNEVYEQFFLYGARDFRSIGHKAIFVANSYRTLGCIGWRHAEPVLRSLAYALLMHEGSNPAQRDDQADRPFRKNSERLQRIPETWKDGSLDRGATGSLLATLRTGSADDACEQVVELLNADVSPQSVWDALHVGAGELLMRQPGIVALHAVTTTNALQFAYHATASDQTRQLMLLQNAAFLPMFREAMHGRGAVSDRTIDDLVTDPGGDDDSAVEEIFSQLNSAPLSAARRAQSFLSRQETQSARAKELIDAARVLIFLKGNDAHDYKFSSAVLEDFYQVSPEWRNVYLASNVFKLRGSESRDNAIVARTRAAFES